jgi:hypothetical protein
VFRLHRETLLDVTVNAIPMVIILFFTAYLLLTSPWVSDPFVMVVAIGLHAVPFVLLGLLTWVAARVIQDAETG